MSVVVRRRGLEGEEVTIARCMTERERGNTPEGVERTVERVYAIWIHEMILGYKQRTDVKSNDKLTGGQLFR